MYENKYYISFIRLFLLLYLIWGIITAIAMVVNPSWDTLIGMAIGGLIPIAVFTLTFILINPVRISENGFIVKEQKQRAIYTKWQALSWNDIYSIKPINLIFFQYISVFAKGYPKPIMVPLSVGKKSIFIDELIRYVPDENPLKVYLTTGKIINFNTVTEDEVLVNAPIAKSQVNTIYENEIFRVNNTLKNGANWFYWIAALSIINAIIILSGSNWSFLAGLYILQIVDLIALEIVKNTPEISIIVMFTTIIFNVFVVGGFVVFGYFANKKHQWSFIVGMVLYALDMLIPLVFTDILSVIIHAIALFGMYSGLRAKFKLNEIDKKAMSIT